MKKYKEDVTREYSLFSIKSWYIGESEELKKWIGFGFFNHVFVSRKGIVTLYYDIEEGEKFWKILEKNLTEEFFDNLCDSFYSLFEQKETIRTDEEIFKLFVKSWPALTIFDELSKYPELGNEYDKKIVKN
tara:strand:- start:180 stop:572 length:393 start_codon:yes stop_codon:yes gene_type:complete